MASKIAEKAPSWFTRLLMPELVEIKGELKNVNTRIDELDKRLTGRLDSLDSKMESRLDSLNN